MKICNIEGCVKKYHAKGYCNRHYIKNTIYGDPNGKSDNYRKYKFCSIESCNKKHYAKGYCKTHYSSKLNKVNGNKRQKTKQEYYLKNKDKMLAASKEYAKENKLVISEKAKEYHLKNKHKSREKARRRKAKKLNNGTEFYTEKQVLDLYGTECYLCNTPIDMQAPRLAGKPGWEKGLHIEHVVDLALGGPDALHNVRPSHGICNLTKKPRQMV